MYRDLLSLAFSLAVLCLLAGHAPSAAAQEGKSPILTIDNFVRTETDNYFRKRVAQGCLGKFVHDREPTAVDKQGVVRLNRDTPYSVAVFDLSQPVTIEKPDTGGRFQSLLVINPDHYLQRVSYEPGTYTFTQEELETRYIQVNARTFVNANDPDDLKKLHEAQDALKVTQADLGKFETPNWEVAELAKL